ncbi:MAG: hypothetical protein R3C56_16110 [Pirellulaceae bacterium]
MKRDKVLLAFLVYSFSLAIYVQARGTSSDVHNASVESSTKIVHNSRDE